MKFLFLYCFSLIFGWLGINSIMIGLAYWDFSGALMPILAGGLMSLISIRLMLATIRMYYPSKGGRDQDLIR